MIKIFGTPLDLARAPFKSQGSMVAASRKPVDRFAPCTGRASYPPPEVDPFYKPSAAGSSPGLRSDNVCSTVTEATGTSLDTSTDINDARYGFYSFIDSEAQPPPSGLRHDTHSNPETCTPL
ncbi:hypothetical protein NDU88_003561 [Pleurodeles waltl]|uniref:Uncharacterized protein n=1 Tax=Pleurodeles waltl TaxID=8319 RepID=A0AAV7SGB0_PLEWA|nr:hypothetical protein NDU88_003561 [Pleurodeles waltl]